MKLTTLTAFAVLSALATPAHAFEGILHVTATLEQMGSMTSRIHVRENGDMRIDNDMPAMGMSMSLLHKRQSKQIVQLMHAQKQYMEMPEPPAEAAPTSSNTLDDYEVKKLGKVKLIGLDAEHVMLTHKRAGSIMEMWLTRDLALADAMKMMSKDPGFDAAVFGSMKKAGLDGYPLKVVAKQDGHTTIIETTKIEKKKLGADLFEIPKGYAKASIPQMPNLTPEQMEMIRKMAEQQQGR